MRRRGGRRGSETKFRRSSYWQTIPRNERRMVPIAGGEQTLLGREIGGDGWRMKCHCASSSRLLRSTNDQHIRKCYTRKCWHWKRDGDIALLTSLQVDGFCITFRVESIEFGERGLEYIQLQSNPNAVVQAQDIPLSLSLSLRKATDKVDFEAGAAGCARAVIAHSRRRSGYLDTRAAQRTGPKMRKVKVVRFRKDMKPLRNFSSFLSRSSDSSLGPIRICPGGGG